MKNAVIYVFSGTGNTLRIARAYADEFFKRGVDCIVHTIDEKGFADFPSPADFDYVGIAYPIHAFNAPYIVHRFADRLPDLPFKEFFVLKSSGEPLSLNNISSGSLVAKLERKGYVLTNEYHYVMPYNMIFRHTDEMASKMWRIARELCAIEAKEILDGRKSFLKPILFGRLVSAVFRIEHPAMKINGRYFKVTDKCVGCNKCVDNCPVHNITRDGDKFKFGSRCIMCARCAFHCPADAINIALLNGWKVNGKYNFENPKPNQTCKKPNFCKKAYEKYFSEALKKISSFKNLPAEVLTFESLSDEFEQIEDLIAQDS